MPLEITSKFLAACLTVLAVTAPATLAGAQPDGRILCEVTENGSAASGTVSVLAGDQEVGSGSCGRPIRVAPGRYTVRIRLDGALDNPVQSRNVDLRPGGSELVRVDFETGLLQVQVTANGNRAAGRAELFQNGRRVGALSGGVSAHVSAGTYSVVVRYRDQERRFDGVTVARGQQRVVSAEF